MSEKKPLTRERREYLIKKYREINAGGKAYLYENEDDVIFDMVYEYYMTHELSAGDHRKAFRACWEWKEKQIKSLTTDMVVYIKKAQGWRTRGQGRRPGPGKELVKLYYNNLRENDKPKWADFQHFCVMRNLDIPFSDARTFKNKIKEIQKEK